MVRAAFVWGFAEVMPFYDLAEEKKNKFLADLKNPVLLNEAMGRLSARSKFLGKFSVSTDSIHFETNFNQLQYEIEYLKGKNIDRIVALTESHNDKTVLEKHFDLHHISILDMGAPTVDQARELAQIIQKADENDEKIAVHCLAGIGRTTTMIIAAELLRGKDFDDLLEQARQQNPFYAFSGSQAQFVRSLADSLK